MVTILYGDFNSLRLIHILVKLIFILKLTKCKCYKSIDFNFFLTELPYNNALLKTINVLFLS